MRLWDDKWSSSRELRWQLKHSKVCRAINYPENIPLEYECVYEKSTGGSKSSSDSCSLKRKKLNNDKISSSLNVTTKKHVLINQRT